MYVGGGFIRITYETDQFAGTTSPSMRYWYPGIDGSANLYDSLYVPGAINSMTGHFHLNSTGPIFFMLGNVTIYNISGTGDEMDIVVPNENITAALWNRSMTYSQLSQRVVPSRFLGAMVYLLSDRLVDLGDDLAAMLHPLGEDAMEHRLPVGLLKGDFLKFADGF